MNHRKSTVRREIKRIEAKRARAAERQSLHGGNTKLVRGMGWSNKLPQPPLVNDVQPVSHKRKKVKVRKVVCSKGPRGRHQFLRDVGVFEYDPYGWSYIKPSTGVHNYKMCVHCGQTLVKSKWGWASSYHYKYIESVKR